MPQGKKLDKPNIKVNARLYKDDWDLLRSLYPTTSGEIVRLCVNSYCNNLRRRQLKDGDNLRRAIRPESSTANEGGSRQDSGETPRDEDDLVE